MYGVAGSNPGTKPEFRTGPGELRELMKRIIKRPPTRRLETVELDLLARLAVGNWHGARAAPEAELFQREAAERVVADVHAAPAPQDLLDLQHRDLAKRHRRPPGGGRIVAAWSRRWGRECFCKTLRSEGGILPQNSAGQGPYLLQIDTCEETRRSGGVT